MYIKKTADLRNEPNTEAEIIANLEAYEEVKVIESRGEWSKISYQGQIGYILSEFLTEENKIASIRKSGLSTRSPSPLATISKSLFMNSL